MRDWMLFNPPADIPEDEEDSDLEKLFEEGFPYMLWRSPEPENQDGATA